MKRTQRRSSYRNANRRFMIFLLVIIVCISGYFIYTFFEQSVMMTGLNEEIDRKEKEIKQLETEIESLGTELKRVNDADYIEEVARKKLKMVMPKDVIYIDDDAARESGE